MTELIAALNVAFPPNVMAFPLPPFGTVSISQFSLSVDGSVFLVNPTPERLLLLEQVKAAHPI